MIERRKGGPKIPDVQALVQEAARQDAGLESMFAHLAEKPVKPVQLEEAFQYAALGNEEKKFTAEGDTVRDATGRALLTLPNPDLVRALCVMDSRIGMFDSELLIRDEHGQLPEASRNIEWMYKKYVSDPMAGIVMKDFPNEKMVPARGIAASINGALYDGNTVLVRDIRHVLNLGDEKGDAVTLMAGVGLGENSTPVTHERISQYLISGQSRLRERFSPEQGATIFPVLLVYDKSKVKGIGGYSFMLPSDPVERSTCILKAYILPRAEY